MPEFRNGLFECCNSTTDCLIGWCVPCVEAGLAANNAGQGTVMAVLQCFFYPLLVPLMRNQVRKERNIDGSCLGDIAAGWCCPCCASIQVKTEFD